ncbi:hypothetical protein KCU78_g7109, partial [Aureobasidium melanogenum]
MANIFHWFNLTPRMSIKIQVEVQEDVPQNLEIVGWHKPSFYALVHLAYAFGRVTDFDRVSGNNPFTFDYVAKNFACHFAVSYVFERILKMGRQTGISIHQLATEIFDCLHSKDVANDEWDNW